MRLNIYMIISIKYFTINVTTIFFYFIIIVATAIITSTKAATIMSLCWITFTIFICQTRTKSFLYIVTNKIFAGNKLNGIFLTLFFFCYYIKNIQKKYLFMLFSVQKLLQHKKVLKSISFSNSKAISYFNFSSTIRTILRSHPHGQVSKVIFTV